MDYKVVLLIIMNVLEQVVGGNDVEYSYSDAEGDDTSGDIPAWQVILIVLGCTVFLLLLFCCFKVYIQEKREERAIKILSEVVSAAASYNQGVTDGQRTHTPPQSSRQEPLNPKPWDNTSRNQTAQAPPPCYGSLQFPRPESHQAHSSRTIYQNI